MCALRIVAGHNYLLHAIRSPFEAERLLLPRLADALGSDASGFHVEFVDGAERITQGSSAGWPGWTFGQLGEENDADSDDDARGDDVLF